MTKQDIIISVAEVVDLLNMSDSELHEEYPDAFPGEGVTKVNPWTFKVLAARLWLKRILQAHQDEIIKRSSRLE